MIDRKYVKVLEPSGYPMHLLETALSETERPSVDTSPTSACSLFGTACLAIILLTGASYLYVRSQVNSIDFNYTELQNRLKVTCDDVVVFEPQGGKVDFTITIPDLYPQRELTKSGGCFDEERLVRVAGSIIWHGTHDLNMKELPLTVFIFKPGQQEPNQQRTGRGSQVNSGFYQLECPTLDLKLKEAYYTWEMALNEQNITSLLKAEDQFKMPRKVGVLSCSEHQVFKNRHSFEDQGWVDVSAVMENPYKKEGTRVTKYPMSNGEDIVFSGKFIIWYGNYNLRMNTDGLLPKTIFAFENANSSNSVNRHYYEFSCAGLEKRLKKTSFQWWKDERLWTSWCIFVISNIAGSFACCFGVFYGERKSRRKFMKNFRRN